MIILSSNHYKPHVGGIENSLYSLSIVYKKMGYDVIIFVSDNDPNYERLKFNEVKEGIQIVRYKSYYPKIYIDYFIKPFVEIWRAERTLKKIINGNKIDLYLARNPITVFAGIKQGLDVKYLVPGIAKNQLKVQLKSFFHIRAIFNKCVNVFTSYLQKKALIKVKNVFVFSKSMSQQVKDYIGFNRKISIVNPGVDIDRFSKSFSIDELKLFKNEIGISEETFIFILVGRLVKNKGFEYALESFSKINTKDKHLLILGDGPEKNNLIKLTEDLSIKNEVSFLGNITNEIEKFYNASNCFIMSSTYEPFGQTIIEAMATGIPVISWKSGGKIQTATSEFMKDGKNGCLVDFEINKMTDAMEDIISLGENEIKKISLNNKNLVSKSFSWEKLAKKLLKS